MAPPTPPPPPRQQVVILSLSSCVSAVELSDGKGGKGMAEGQIIQPRKSLVHYKSFNTLWSTQTSHPLKNLEFTKTTFPVTTPGFSLSGPHGPDAELLSEPRPHHLLQPERRQRGVLPWLPRLGDAQQERLHYYRTVLVHNGAATQRCCYITVDPATPAP